jgi:DNA-binding CsgD family transcriptional regulator
MKFRGWHNASARVLTALGTPEFASTITTAIHTIVPYEFTVIFAYYCDSKPIDIYDDFPALKRKVMVEEYQEGPYLLDPFYLQATQPSVPGLVRLRDLAPDRFYQAEYFRNYYVRTGLAEEIGFVIDVGEDVTVVISAMREHKVFSAREFRDLEEVFPFVHAAAIKQWDGLITQFADRPVQAGPRLQLLIDEAFQRFGRNLLTPRESEVVEYVLKGHSADATGQLLGISPGTVRIHRRNIYAKLRVSSQGELFSKFISSLKEFG